MTYDEREKQLCRECIEKETCPYILRKLEYKCQHLSDMMYGWELGCKDAIDKACEWLRDNHVEIFLRYLRGHDSEDEVEHFKKYMEEKQ